MLPSAGGHLGLFHDLIIKDNIAKHGWTNISVV